MFIYIHILSYYLLLSMCRKKQILEVQQKTTGDEKDTEATQGRLLICLIKAYTPILLLSAFYKLLYHLLEFATPSILRLVSLNNIVSPVV